jgi:modulator of FtsH protease
VEPFSGWESFYVIVGSSAGALTGLTFVAVTLTAEMRSRGAGQGIPAYTTPTIVHFGVVLFICALLSAPWPDLALPAIALGLTGLVGLTYTLIVTRRLRRFNRNYAPVLEDWLANAAAPLIAYLALAVGGALLSGNAGLALFVTAGAMLLLLFDGIHNAWDVATYIVVERVLRNGEGDETKE